ncbi:hypothetical protein J6590_004121 [Homalodisca vitripennis]|nr:hypothetical protein J6590_004121 [Homalodisca vitripennis]
MGKSLKITSQNKFNQLQQFAACCCAGLGKGSPGSPTLWSHSPLSSGSVFNSHCSLTASDVLSDTEDAVTVDQ